MALCIAVYFFNNNQPSCALMCNVEDADTSHAGYGPGIEGTDSQHSGAAVQGASLESIQSRLGPRGYDEVKVRSHIGVTASDAAIAVSDEIMRVLKEPAHMKDTFSKFQ